MSITVSGAHGVLAILAALCFLVAAIVAWVVMPRSYWPTLVAAGLLLWVLTLIIH